MLYFAKGVRIIVLVAKIRKPGISMEVKKSRQKKLAEDIKRRKHIDGSYIIGGDPFYQQEECVSLLKLLPKHLDIWIYTGFKYEEIKDTRLAQMADYIVDGKFEQDKLVTGKMYGSSNQRIIDIKKGGVIL